MRKSLWYEEEWNINCRWRFLFSFLPIKLTGKARPKNGMHTYAFLSSSQILFKGTKLSRREKHRIEPFVLLLLLVRLDVHKGRLLDYSGIHELSQFWWWCLVWRRWFLLRRSGMIAKARIFLACILRFDVFGQYWCLFSFWLCSLCVGQAQILRLCKYEKENLKISCNYAQLIFLFIRYRAPFAAVLWIMLTSAFSVFAFDWCYLDHAEERNGCDDSL